MTGCFTARQQVESLRALADFIEANPDLPWDGYVGGVQPWSFVHVEAGAVTKFASTPGGWTKTAYDGPSGGNFELRRMFGDAIELRVIAPRDSVCEKRVVGTETVEVPDPDAPKVTVEREVVEWVCSPVLAKAVG